jgi:hypothetical protein
MPRSLCTALPGLRRRIAPVFVNDLSPYRPNPRSTKFMSDTMGLLGNWVPFSHDRSVGGCLISNYSISYIRSSVPRHGWTTACTKGNGMLLTSQARDARCLCTYVSAIYTSKRRAQTFHAPSKARVAWSLTVWHRVRSLGCVARRSCVSVWSRLRGRLVGGHSQVHDPILSSSAAFYVLPIQSRSRRGPVRWVRWVEVLEAIGFFRGASRKAGWLAGWLAGSL